MAKYSAVLLVKEPSRKTMDACIPFESPGFYFAPTWQIVNSLFKMKKK